jgi:mxaA protein
MRAVGAALLLAWALWGAPPPAAAQALPPAVQADEPRAYGYHVGDLVERRVSLFVPDGWRLDERSVPRPGARGRAIELRTVTALADEAAPGGRWLHWTLQYQVMLAPAAVKVLETPPLLLRGDGARRAETLRVDAWPITVAPMLTPEVANRRGLGELQPDLPPPRPDTAAATARLAVYGGLAALLALAWAGATWGPPWAARRRTAFRSAWRALGRLPDRPDAGAWREACRRLHEALNQSAGEVLFEAGLDRFVARRPTFAAVQDDLRLFLRRSRAEFFGVGDAPAPDGAWLRALCRRCLQAERDAG